MYKFELSVEQVVSWIEKLAPKLKQAVGPKDIKIPKELTTLLAKTLANVDIPLGDFIYYVTKRLIENPPSGYRLQKGDLGQLYVKKQKHGPKSTERPLHKGAKFRDKVFIGLWWYTDTPKSSASVKLRNALKHLGGGIFYKKPGGVGFTEYFGYAIVPQKEADAAGTNLKTHAEALKKESQDREYFLSAIRLDSLAEGDTVKTSDVFTVPDLFRSQKFNWELNLPEVLNGRSRERGVNLAMKDLLKSYQP